ncbi:hypothetical protein Tco_0204276 [Tanacetum coccineum]
MSMWIISRGVVLLILLMEYKFQVGYNGFTSHVITTIADRIRGGSLLALKCLVWFMKYYANVRRTVADFSHAPLNEYSPSPDDKKQWSLGCWFGGKLIQKLRQKGVYEESFSSVCCMDWGKLIQFMHTTMVPVQVKTMKIQAGIQVSRPRELTRQLQLWKTLFLLYLYLIGTLLLKRSKIVEDGANDCYSYGKSGHHARDCRLPKRIEENTNLVMEEDEKVDGIVMMAYEEFVEEEALMAYEDDVGVDTQWCLDTAARNHMCGDKGLFLEMKEVVDVSVLFGDEAKTFMYVPKCLRRPVMVEMEVADKEDEEVVVLVF